MQAVQEQVQEHVEAVTAAYRREIEAIQAQLSSTPTALVRAPALLPASVPVCSLPSLL
jgi:hypothetical protein